MSQVILHHYPLSPFSEKIRLALVLAGFSWNSVEIPVWTPRPKLTPMTRGYRRTPILQVGAEFYCNYVSHSSSHRTVGNARFSLPEASGRCRKSSWLVYEKGSFMNAVCLTIGNMPSSHKSSSTNADLSSSSISIPRCCVPSGRSTCRFSTPIFSSLAVVLSYCLLFPPLKGTFRRLFVRLPPYLVLETKRWPLFEPFISFPSLIDPSYNIVAFISHGQFS